MNSRFTLAVALLLSGVPFATFANDRDCSKSDLKQMMCDCRETNGRLVANTEVAKLAGAYVITSAALSNCKYSDVILHKFRKVLKKFILNNLIFQDSVNINLDLPSLGKTTVLNTDQFLEVLLVVVCDLLHDKSAGDVVVDGGLTLVREEVVAVALWILDQLNVEGVLPESVTDGEAYQEVRNEIARHYVDKGLVKLGLQK